MNPLELDTNARSVHVIGAGIIGICCAWHLKQKGFNVTVIDSSDAATQTSYGNAGCVSPTNIIPFSHPKLLRELPQWLLIPNSPLSLKWRQLFVMFPWLKAFWKSGRERVLRNNINAAANLMSQVQNDWNNIVQDASAEKFLHQQGVIKLFDNKKQVKQHQWSIDLLEEYDFSYKTVAGLKLQSLEPDLKVTDQMSGLYFPSWQHLINPQAIVSHLAKQLRDQGVHFIKQKVQALSKNSDGLVRIQAFSEQELTASNCVIACGVWSNSLAEQIDYKVPLLAKRGYHISLPETNIQLNHPLLPMNDYVIMTPMNDGLRIAGAAEFDQIDAPADYRKADAILRRTLKYFPQMPLSKLTQWMGQRPMLPDSLPIISTSPNHNNIFYAFGHGHSGMTQGPTTGRLIAELISNEISQAHLTDYRFDRFKQ